MMQHEEQLLNEYAAQDASQAEEQQDVVVQSREYVRRLQFSIAFEILVH
jgi:hypothetical protein